MLAAVWSSGVILRLGRRGPGFESLNGPSFAYSKAFNNENKACPPSSFAFLAQWLERLAVNRKVAGSIPVVGALVFAVLLLTFVTRFVGVWRLFSKADIA